MWQPRKGESPEDFAERRRESARRYRAANPEKVRAWGREGAARRRAADPEPARRASREYARRRYLAASSEEIRAAKLRTYHGMTLDDWRAMWDAQDGRCYLCGELMEATEAHIDHDHAHHPGSRKSCASCRRGLAHAACNQGIGLAGDSPDLLRRWAAALEAAQRRDEVDRAC